MRKLVWWGLVLLTACHPVEQDSNQHWHQVNKVYWSQISDTPYPFIVDSGEIACERVSDELTIYYFTGDTGQHEDGIGYLIDTSNPYIKQGTDYERLGSDLARLCD